jgi:hypothetical protein
MQQIETELFSGLDFRTIINNIHSYSLQTQTFDFLLVLIFKN